MMVWKAKSYPENKICDYPIIAYYVLFFIYFDVSQKFCFCNVHGMLAQKQAQKLDESPQENHFLNVFRVLVNDSPSRIMPSKQYFTCPT